MATKALGFKPKENGGKIRGPGTGTSDSIATQMRPGTYIMPADSTKTIGDDTLKKIAESKVPVRVSNGEYEFTPEQVQSVGAAVLTALRDSTHKPVDKPAGQPKGFFGGGMIGGGLSTKSRGDGPFGEISFSQGVYVPEKGLLGEEQLEWEERMQGLENKRQAFKSRNSFGGMGIGSYANGGTIQPRGFQPFANGGQVEIEEDGSPVAMGSLAPLDSNRIVGRIQTKGPGKAEYNEQYGYGQGTGRGSAPFDFRTGKKNEGYRHGFKANPTRGQGLAGGGLVRDDQLAASGMMSNDGTFIPEYQGGKNRMDMYGSTMRGRTGLANGGMVARGFQPQHLAAGGEVEQAYERWQEAKTPWYMPTPAGNMEERTAEAAYTQALRNSYSGNSSPSATGQPGGPSRQAAPAPDAAPTQSAPQQSAFNASTAKDPTYGLAPTKANPQPTAQTKEKTSDTANPASQANAPEEIAPGVYRHGRGQYSDQTTGMGFKPGFTGVPNAQNEAAANVLHEQGVRESAARLAAKDGNPYWVGKARGFSDADARQYANEVAAAQSNAQAANIKLGNRGSQEWANFNDLTSPERIAARNFMVSANSTVGGGGRVGRNGQGPADPGDAKQAASLQGYNAVVGSVARRAAGEPGLAENQRQFDAQQGLAVRQQDSAERNAELAAREQARQTHRKEGMDDVAFATASENARLELAAAQRKAAAFDEYSKAPPEMRQKVAAQYPDLFGGNGDRWKGIALQGGMDAHGNKTEGILAAVNERTGEMRRLDGGAGQAAPTSRPVGTTSTVNGKTAVWDGTKWVPRG